MACSPTTQHSIEWPVWVKTGPDETETGLRNTPESRHCQCSLACLKSTDDGLVRD